MTVLMSASNRAGRLRLASRVVYVEWTAKQFEYFFLMDFDRFIVLHVHFEVGERGQQWHLFTKQEVKVI